VLTKPYQPGPAPSYRDRHAEVEIEVERVVITEIYDQQLIVFREVNAERRFHLLTGIFEATAVDRSLRGIPTPRPLTHDAWYETIEALQGNLQMACISGWSKTLEKTYIAELRVNTPQSQVCVDVRPSDAVVMALISDSPIVVANDLLTEADSGIQWGPQ
jgi:bifunctional DNase/RNase